MKKLIFPAFCLSLALTSINVSAANDSNSNVISVLLNDDERKVIKTEELPEPVTKAVAGDAYKGWSIKEAAMVNPGASAGTADKKADPYYEVTLTKEKETKVVKFHKDGTLLN